MNDEDKIIKQRIAMTAIVVGSNFISDSSPPISKIKYSIAMSLLSIACNVGDDEADRLIIWLEG